ncbi:MAG TPA: YCF48-related protein, partial [Gemmataceae bacterium]|nr:YCF48-related protein [Gemmataceae bacterium]
MRSYLLALAACAALALPAQAVEQRYPEDAALRAVQFLDGDVGFAVGDDGVIWKTINSGNKWELMPSGVHSSLRSIHMLTHLVGWVVGREELPLGAGSAGVVLFTQDGGETWKRILADAVPGLNSIRFGDVNTAYIVGDGSEQFPTGVFMTGDGGRKWQPVKGQRCTSWLGADFLDGQTGSFAGSWSRLGAVREGNFGKADVDSLAGRNILGLQLRPTRSFAVGQGGLVL